MVIEPEGGVASAEYSELPSCIRCGAAARCRVWKAWPRLSICHSVGRQYPAQRRLPPDQHASSARHISQFCPQDSDHLAPKFWYTLHAFRSPLRHAEGYQSRVPTAPGSFAYAPVDHTRPSSYSHELKQRCHCSPCAERDGPAVVPFSGLSFEERVHAAGLRPLQLLRLPELVRWDSV